MGAYRQWFYSLVEDSDMALRSIDGGRRYPVYKKVPSRKL